MGAREIALLEKEQFRITKEDLRNHILHGINAIFYHF